MNQWNKRRSKIATCYKRNLFGYDLVLLHVPEGAIRFGTYMLYVIRCQNRDLLQSKLKDARIGTLIHYPTLPHIQEAYKICIKSGRFSYQRKAVSVNFEPVDRPAAFVGSANVCY